jgi:hypothetical protein
MIEFLFQFIAVLAYLICGIRIACYSPKETAFHRGYSWLATLLIASFLGQSVHILFFKDPVTLWDAIFTTSCCHRASQQRKCGQTNLESIMKLLKFGAKVQPFLSYSNF